MDLVEIEQRALNMSGNSIRINNKILLDLISENKRLNRMSEIMYEHQIKFAELLEECERDVEEEENESIEEESLEEECII